jgi:hypothetical protein
VYAVAAGRVSKTAVARLPALPEAAAPHLVPISDDLCIVAATVPADVYDAGALERRLADVDWVSRAGAAHHAVIEALAEKHDVVPLRFMTLFSSEAKAVAAFKRARARLRRALDRVTGRAEWVLRVGRPEPARTAAGDAPREAATSGAAFLRAKAEARRARIETAQRLANDATRLLDALRAIADETATREVEPGGSLLIDAALLVRRRRVDRLHKTLKEYAGGLSSAGCSVSLTGPWPPYSFASVDQA